jgi:small neutral amino acid transporter SnatA (MarC family)
MADRPPFDSQRAAFLLLLLVIGVYALAILGMVGACLYHSDLIFKGDASCDPYSRLMSLMAAALAAALAFAGVRDRRPPDDKDKPP